MVKLDWEVVVVVVEICMVSESGVGGSWRGSCEFSDSCDMLCVAMTSIALKVTVVSKT